LEYWSIGVLEYWGIGVLEYWSIGALGEIVGLHISGGFDFEIECRNETRGTPFFAEWAAFPKMAARVSKSHT
jgi:hypothetical protein